MRKHYFILTIATCFALCVFCIVGCQQAPTSSDSGPKTYTLNLNPIIDASNGPPYTTTAETLSVYSGFQHYYAHLLFDLSSINTNECTLISATLYFTVSTLTNTGTTHIKLITSTWEASNLCKFDGNSFPTYGSDIMASQINTVTTWSADLTTGVQQWFNGTTNYGIAFIPDSPTNYSFYSKESLHPPVLTIKYSK